MPASPIKKEITVLNNEWVQLQKMMTPDQVTDCYWSVWNDVEKFTKIAGVHKGTAWLMWCPIGDDPSINDSWSHAEEINEDCKNVLDVIETVYGISFHEFIWVELDKDKEFPAKSKEWKDTVGIKLPSE